MHARFARLASLGKIHPRYSCLEKRIRDNISTNGGNRAGKTQANSGSHFFRLEIFTPRCRGRGHCTTSATLKTTWILFSSDVFTTVTVHTYPFWSENVDFFRRFGLPKCIFLNRSPEYRFLKTLASRLRVDGRKRRFSNTMMQYIILQSITHALWGMLSYFHYVTFSHGRPKTIRIRYVWTRIFLKTEEKKRTLFECQCI